MHKIFLPHSTFKTNSWSEEEEGDNNTTHCGAMVSPAMGPIIIVVVAPAWYWHLPLPALPPFAIEMQ